MRLLDCSNRRIDIFFWGGGLWIGQLTCIWLSSLHICTASEILSSAEKTALQALSFNWLLTSPYSRHSNSLMQEFTLWFSGILCKNLPNLRCVDISSKPYVIQIIEFFSNTLTEKFMAPSPN